MANRIYEFEYNGRIYDIEAPEGATPASLAAVVDRAQVPTEAPDRTWGEAFTDTGAALHRGIGGLTGTIGDLGMLTGITDPNNAMQQAGERMQKAAGAYESLERQQERKDNAAAMAAASKRGFGAELWTGAKQALSSPVSFLAEQAPNLVGGLGTGFAVKSGVKLAMRNAAEEAVQKVAARAGYAGAVGGGAALQGAEVGGGAYDRAIAAGATQEQALSIGRQAAATAAATSIATQFIPGMRNASLEGMIFGKGVAGGFAKGLAKGALGESVQEGAEEGSGQLGANLAMRRVNPNQDLMEGVGGAMGAGMAGGAMFGGGTGALTGAQAHATEGRQRAADALDAENRATAGRQYVAAGSGIDAIPGTASKQREFDTWATDTAAAEGRSAEEVKLTAHKEQSDNILALQTQFDAAVAEGDIDAASGVKQKITAALAALNAVGGYMPNQLTAMDVQYDALVSERAAAEQELLDLPEEDEVQGMQLAEKLTALELQLTDLGARIDAVPDSARPQAPVAPRNQYLDAAYAGMGTDAGSYNVTEQDAAELGITDPAQVAALMALDINEPASRTQAGKIIKRAPASEAKTSFIEALDELATYDAAIKAKRAEDQANLAAQEAQGAADALKAKGSAFPTAEVDMYGDPVPTKQRNPPEEDVEVLPQEPVSDFDQRELPFRRAGRPQAELDMFGNPIPPAPEAEAVVETPAPATTTAEDIAPQVEPQVEMTGAEVVKALADISATNRNNDTGRKARMYRQQMAAGNAVESDVARFVQESMVAAPKVAAPKESMVAAPEVAAPKVAAPKVAAPKVAAPKVAAPKVAAPKVEPTVEERVAALETKAAEVEPTVEERVAALETKAAEVEPKAAPKVAKVAKVAPKAAPKVERYQNFADDLAALTAEFGAQNKGTDADLEGEGYYKQAGKESKMTARQRRNATIKELEALAEEVERSEAPTKPAARNKPTERDTDGGLTGELTFGSLSPEYYRAKLKIKALVNDPDFIAALKMDTKIRKLEAAGDMEGAFQLDVEYSNTYGDLIETTWAQVSQLKQDMGSARYAADRTAGATDEAASNREARSATRAAVPKEHQALYLALANNDIGAALRHIASQKRPQMDSLMAKLLLQAKVLPNVTFFGGTIDGGASGAYSTSNDTVRLLFNDDVTTFTRVVLHETVHAGTLHAIGKAYSEWTAPSGSRDANYRRTAEYKAAARIFDIFQHLLGDAKFHAHYGSTNVGELVADVFTRPDLQDYLMSVKLPASMTGGTVRTAFSWFAHNVRMLLGLQSVPNSAMAQLLRDVPSLIRTRKTGEATTLSDAEAEGLHGVRDFPPRYSEFDDLPDPTMFLHRELAAPSGNTPKKIVTSLKSLFREDGRFDKLVSVHQTQAQMDEALGGKTGRPSVADIKALRDSKGESLAVFGDTFATHIKAKDRTLADADRIATAVLEEFIENPTFAETTPATIYEMYKRRLLMPDGNTYDPEVLAHANATPETIAVYDLERGGRTKAQAATEAETVNTNRRKALVKLATYLKGNRDYTPTAAALILNAASRFSVRTTKKTVEILPIASTNDATVVVDSVMASRLQEQLSSGKPLKEAFKLAVEASITANKAKNKQLKREGLVKFSQSDTEEAAIELNAAAAGTPWCTGGAVSTARDHISGGDFYIIFKDGAPQVAFRMAGANNLAEPPRGTLENQALTAEQDAMAEEALRSGEVEGGANFIADRDFIASVMDGTASAHDAFVAPEKRRVENGYGGAEWPASITREIERLTATLDPEVYVVQLTPDSPNPYRARYVHTLRGFTTDTQLTEILHAGTVRDNTGNIDLYSVKTVGDVVANKGDIDLSSATTVGEVAGNNGDINLSSATTVGDVTRNDGDIDLSSATTVGDVTGNEGNIDLSSATTVGEVKYSTGTVDLSSATTVGDVEYNTGTVNLSSATTVGDVFGNEGTINLSSAKTVGNVRGNNGDTDLSSAKTVGDVTGNNGDINLSNVTTVGDVEFNEGNIDLSSATTVGNVGYNVTINLSSATTVGNVRANTGDIKLPKATKVGDVVANNGDINLSSATTVGDVGYNTGTVNLSSATTVGDVFGNEGTINLSSAKTVGNVRGNNGDIDLSSATTAGEVAGNEGNIDLSSAKTVGVAGWNISGAIKWHPSMQHRESKAAGGIQGVAADGRVHLVADSIPVGSELAVFLHEMGAHIGFDQILNGADRIWLEGRIRTWAKEKGTVRGEAARAAIKRAEAGSTEATLADETVAYMVEELVTRGVKPEGMNQESTWLRRVFKALRNALDKLKIRSDAFSDQDLVDMAFGAAKIAMRGGKRGTSTAARMSKATPTNAGKAAIKAAQAMGHSMPDTSPTARFNAAVTSIKNTVTPTAKTGLDAYAATFGDKQETRFLNASAALNNAIRRRLASVPAGTKALIGTMLRVSDAQALHSNAVAADFVVHGGIRYDDEVHKFEVFDAKDNFVAMHGLLADVAKKHGLTDNEAGMAFNAATEARRMDELNKWKASRTADIAALEATAKGLKGTKVADTRKRDLLRKTAKVMQKAVDSKLVHLTDAQIAHGLSIFESMPELAEVVASWESIRDTTVKLMADTGVYSKEQAEDYMSSVGYVPFFREEQLATFEGPKEFLRGMQVARDHKFKGSSAPLNDVMDNMARFVQYAVSRAVINQRAVAIIDTTMDVMPDGFVTRSDANAPNVVRVLRNGVPAYYSFSDPWFVQAFTGLDAAAIPAIKMVSWFSNLLRKNVVLNPLFGLSQVPQDAMAAIFTSGLAPQYALQIPFRAVKEFVVTLANASRTHNELKHYSAVGVRDYSAAVARNDAERLAGMKKLGALGKIVAGLEKISMASDNAVRQAVYEAAVAQGKPKAEALELAFNLIHFKRKGSSAKLAWASGTIPFMNAYISATDVAIKTLTGRGISPGDRKQHLATLAQTTAVMMVLSMFYAMANADDEDYLAKDRLIRDRLLMIPGSGGLAIPMRMDVFSLPKIFAEHMYLLLTDKAQEDPAALRKSMWNALSHAALSPTAVPQLFKPALEVAIDHSFFTGRDLIGKNMKQWDTANQYTNSTSELGKMIGASGVISPISADHLIRGTLGTSGALAMWTTNNLINAEPGVSRPDTSMGDLVASFPGMGVFTSKEFGAGLKTDFYDLKNEVDKVTTTFAALERDRPMQAAGYLLDPEHPERLKAFGLKDAVEGIHGTLTEIRAQVTLITNLPDDIMSPSQKKELIHSLRQSESAMLKAVPLKMLREMSGMND